MPKLTIELTNEKLQELTPKLLDLGIRYMVKPDDNIEIIAHKSQGMTIKAAIDTGAFNPEYVTRVKEPSTRHVTTVHKAKNKKLYDVILEYFTDASVVLCSEQIGNRITEYGYQASSASALLHDLYKDKKLVRIKEASKYYYSLAKEDSNA